MKRSSTGIHPLSLIVLTLMMVHLAACGPTTQSTFAAPEATSEEKLDATPVVNTQVPSQVPQAIATASTVPATDLPALLMIATSRGPNLVATDPSSVSLASGQLQLVEFFRFT